MIEMQDNSTVFRADVLHFAKDLARRITELPGYEVFFIDFLLSLQQ